MAKSSTKAKKTPSKKATSPRPHPHSYRKSSRKPTSRKTPGRDVVKRGEEVEFDAVTHIVVAGKYEGFQGVKVGEDTEKNTISLRLVSNKRGDKRTDQGQVAAFALDDVKELDSYDMLNFVGKDGEDEDEALKAHEAGSWECPKCGKSNSNDSSVCKTIVGTCGGKPELELKETVNENGEKEKVKSWKCTKCGNETDDGSICTVVNICGGVPECKEKLDWAGTLLAFTKKNMWTCTHCLVSNNASDDKCMACDPDSAVGQARTASVDEVTETLEETTLEGSIGSGGFTFGPTVSNED